MHEAKPVECPKGDRDFGQALFLKTYLFFNPNCLCIATVICFYQFELVLPYFLPLSAYPSRVQAMFHRRASLHTRRLYAWNRTSLADYQPCNSPQRYSCILTLQEVLFRYSISFRLRLNPLQGLCGILVHNIHHKVVPYLRKINIVCCADVLVIVKSQSYNTAVIRSKSRKRKNTLIV